MGSQGLCGEGRPSVREKQSRGRPRAPTCLTLAACLFFLTQATVVLEPHFIVTPGPTGAVVAAVHGTCTSSTTGGASSPSCGT